MQDSLSIFESYKNDPANFNPKAICKEHNICISVYESLLDMLNLYNKERIEDILYLKNFDLNYLLERVSYDSCIPDKRHILNLANILKYKGEIDIKKWVSHYLFLRHFRQACLTSNYNWTLWANGYKQLIRNIKEKRDLQTVVAISNTGEKIDCPYKIINQVQVEIKLEYYDVKIKEIRIKLPKHLVPSEKAPIKVFQNDYPGLITCRGDELILFANSNNPAFPSRISYSLWERSIMDLLE